MALFLVELADVLLRAVNLAMDLRQ